MKTFYEYMFYKLYRYALFMRDANTGAEPASNLLSGVIFVYTISILLRIVKLNAASLHPLIIFSTVIIIAGLITYYNLKYFERDNRFVDIVEHYLNESKTSRILGNILAFVFCFGSVALFIIVVRTTFY